MSDNGTSRSAPRRGALLWLVGGDRAYEGYKERGSRRSLFLYVFFILCVLHYASLGFFRATMTPAVMSTAPMTLMRVICSSSRR